MTRKHNTEKKIHVSELRISRAWLRYIRDIEYGMQELIWIRHDIAYYLRIIPKKMPEAFGGIAGFEVTFFSVCCRGTMHFGSIGSMMRWLNEMFHVVSVQ